MSFRFAPPDMRTAVALDAPIPASKQAPPMLDKGAPLISGQAQRVSWMDRYTYGVKNRLLAYGAGGLAVLILGFVFLKKPSSVAGYRRRRR